MRRRARQASEPTAQAADDPGGAARVLRRALENAVARRLGGTTACHVSGGTDSTSVALLAARLLAAGTARETSSCSPGAFARGELAGGAAVPRRGDGRDPSARSRRPPGRRRSRRRVRLRRLRAPRRRRRRASCPRLPGPVLEQAARRRFGTGL
ncbi:asparagine synthase-related protein [Streptomyces tricolor]|nr:asparagine synthase-related protein [Streptomyces tricolor]